LTTPPLSRLRLVSITPLATNNGRVASAKVVYETTVEPSDCNTWGTIHGGCVFTLCNAVGKIATAVVVKGARKIVSTDLTTNYLAGVSVGKKVTLEVECLRTTRALGFLRGVVRDQSGSVCYIWVQNVGFEL
ncbi:Acyl-coenzyme A thioesterase 13, partial [Coemansia sp. RSA 2599]